MQDGKPLARNSTYKCVFSLTRRSLLMPSYSLGTNQGTSVLTVIETLSLIAQRPIKIVVCARRPGDLGCVVCSVDKAERELGWKAERGIVEMCRDLVNWQAVSWRRCFDRGEADVRRHSSTLMATLRCPNEPRETRIIAVPHFL